MASWKSVGKQYLLGIGRENQEKKMTKRNTPKLFTRTKYIPFKFVYLEKKSLQ